MGDYIGFWGGPIGDYIGFRGDPRGLYRVLGGVYYKFSPGLMSRRRGSRV